MEEDRPTEKPDFILSGLKKQDLYDLSVEDLEARIENLAAEIDRCRALVGDRSSSRAAAESLFKS
ncbi:MAG: DUF1192 domain-containing protein [Pseudomonadota bacterium]